MNSIPLFQLSCHSYLFLCGPSLMSYVPFSLSCVGLFAVEPFTSHILIRNVLTFLQYLPSQISSTIFCFP